MLSGIRDTAKDEDVNPNKLLKHISMLLELREKGNHEKADSLGHFPWPNDPHLQRLKEMLSSRVNRPIQLMHKALKRSKKCLEEMRVNVAIVAPLVVADTLEILRIKKSEERWHLIKGMHDLTIDLKRLRESTERMQDVMQKATLLIIEGALLCSTEVASLNLAKEDSGVIIHGFVSVVYLKDFMEKLKAMSIKINLRITAIEPQGRSHLSKGNAIHTDNGQVEEDLLLTGQVEEDLLVPEPQKAYIHNNEQDLLVPEPQKVYINTGQVEEDLLVPEPQKAYIHNNEQVEEDLLSTGRQKVFKLEALEVATNNFHEDNKVGQGGYGAVYKGITNDGKQIAVKKMSFISRKQSPEYFKKQFENEKLLAKIRHRNLVKLLGSCKQESQVFLVYEYLPNESLDKFLFYTENRKRLDWYKRYNIIKGIARGLQYLHEESGLPIVHRDIKASNILLDEKLNPKIGDFGTANLFPEDRTHVTATPIGTCGYIAPEYVSTGEFSFRTDVYSYGIVLLELLTGERISSKAIESLRNVWCLYKRNEALLMLDPTMIETCYKESTKALRCIQVGLLCIQKDPLLRPKMSEVTTMLSTTSESLPVPNEPPYQLL